MSRTAQDEEDGPVADEFYYNTETGQVEQGKQSTWSHLMGPYPTREAAQHALDKARARTEAWDEEDRRDR
ncbi:SPOR domain-containing protein [Cellulosimicrobium cellulans]|uniref:SPOR domain-containing protein n=1 Tax=Cellulosimicrobium cellulans TaxID=1710 RepID=UPI0021CB2D86|nr:SPOR domain-containing protein [Cellulosimicrobium cellulans]